MIPGFNHNIKHGGRTFHVQTEDSGPNPPLIMTHVFIGGNIIASSKKQYSELVHAENFEEQVRQLMQGQHKTMLRNLVNGVYDETVDKFVASGALPPVSEDARSAETPQPEPLSLTSGPTGTEPELPVLGRDTQEGPAARMAEVAAQTAPTIPVSTPALAPSADTPIVGTLIEEPSAPTDRTPSPLAGVSPEPDAGGSPTARGPLLTPAPVVVGNAGTRGLGAAPSKRRTTQRGFARPDLSAPTADAAADEQSVESTRAAAPPEELKPFGADHISDRRLDEVILGFLLEERGK